MQMKHFDKMGIDASRLGFGLMRLPVREDGKIDRAKALDMVDYAYHHGVNYFDTAWRYHGGESECFAKEALSRYPRESYYLATKFPIGFMPEESEDQVDKIFDEQLEKTGAEYFDFYLVHGLGVSRLKTMEKINLIKHLEERKAKGQIKHLGFSFHESPENLKTILDYYDKWEFCQIQLNYMDWTFQDAKGQYELLTERGIPVIVMEPVRGGTFAEFSPSLNKMLKDRRPDNSVASWALRFCGSLPNVHVILSGMTEMYQVEDNVKTFDNFVPYEPDEYKIIEKMLEIRRKEKTIPCTSCRYCTEYCPQNLDIPELFREFNEYRITNNSFGLNLHVKELDESALPANCIACGACAEHCPQHIDIPGLMKDFDDVVKKL